MVVEVVVVVWRGGGGGGVAYWRVRLCVSVLVCLSVLVCVVVWLWCVWSYVVLPVPVYFIARAVRCVAMRQVKLVYHAKTNRTFAMKILQKAQIQQLRQQANIMNERDLMMKIDHPFILKLYDTYKDRDRLYMLLELVQVRCS